MKATEIYNKKYAELCQEMGHLQFNLEKITKRMQELRAAVMELEQLMDKANKQQAATENKNGSVQS